MPFLFVPKHQWIWLLDTMRRIQIKLEIVSNMENAIMADLTQLTADVTANKDTIDSAVTLLQGLKAALDAAGTDPAKLAELSSQLEANTNALAAAVVANTPAA